jgi:nicotinate phosphoribosyltransferase
VRRRKIHAGTEYEDLLVPMMRDGAPVAAAEPIAVVRDRAQANLYALHAGIKRFIHPHEYPVGLEKGLHELRNALILKAREDEA